MEVQNLSSTMLKSNKFAQCIVDCMECYESCTSSIQHCLSEGGKHIEPSHLNLMMECARLCQISAEFMMSGSAYSEDLCNVCSEICDACAESCLAVDVNDKMMQECAEICRRCSRSCNKMQT